MYNKAYEFIKQEKIKEEKRKVAEVLKSIRGCEGGDAYITAEDAQALDVAIRFLEG